MPHYTIETNKPSMLNNKWSSFMKKHGQQKTIKNSAKLPASMSNPFGKTTRFKLKKKPVPKKKKSKGLSRI